MGYYSLDHYVQPPIPKKRTKRLWLFLALGVTVVAVAAGCATVLFWRSSYTVEKGYDETYVAVRDSIDEIERSYRDEGSYHNPDQIPDLLDEVERYGLENTALVSSVDRGDDYVEYRLSDGTLFMFVPELEGVLSGGADCSIVTLEPWWTDVKDVDSLRIEDGELSIDGFTEASGFDVWAHSVAETLGEYSFAAADNVNDSEVTLDRLKSIGRNQFVFYLGHGCAPTRSHGASLTTGECVTKETKKAYRDDLKSGKLVRTTSGRFAVTDKFFDSEPMETTLSRIPISSCWPATPVGTQGWQMHW